MRTRVFIAINCGIAALPLAAHAQQAVPSTAQAASTDISGVCQIRPGFPSGWMGRAGMAGERILAIAGFSRQRWPG
jgi:hypothetical protein